MKRIHCFVVSIFFCNVCFATTNPQIIQKNKDAWKSFLKDDKLKAEESLSQALALDAADPYTRFNWATSKLLSSIDKDGKVSPQLAEEALREFEVLDRDLTQNLSQHRNTLAKELKYQIGVTQELLKKPEKALEYYYSSLLEGKTASELDEKSRKNIERLLVLIDQSGGGGGSNDQDQDNSGDSQNQQEGPGDKKNDLKDGDDANQSRQKPKFSETDLNEQEARQILESVKNEEQEVQRRKSRAEARERASKMERGERGQENSGRQW